MFHWRFIAHCNRYSTVFFENFARLFRTPKSVVFSWDTRFAADFWKAFWDISRRKWFSSSNHHLEIDSSTQRAHRTIEQIIYTHVLESSSERYLVSEIPFEDFSVNSAISGTTGKSFLYLIYSFLLAAPIDRLDYLYRIDTS